MEWRPRCWRPSRCRAASSLSGSMRRVYLSPASKADPKRRGQGRNSMVNVCMVGHGMMGTWHSEGLKRADCQLHTVVGRVPGKATAPKAGRQPESTAEFAARYGYQKWATSLDEALND